jgi:stage V sporulation protein B
MEESLLKNTEYNILKNIFNRLGGLALTILLTRLLLPDLFGVYSLTLSIIMILIIFTDLGINNALTRYVSNALSKNNKTLARSYFYFFTKIKIYISILMAVSLASLAYPLSEFIFQKSELFWPLLAGSAFILLSPIAGIFDQFFFITKKIKSAVKAEIIFQFGRLIFVTIAITVFTQINPVAGIFLGLTIGSLIFTSYAFNYTYKKCKFIFENKRTEIERKKLIKFLSYLTISSIGLIFLGSIDTLMLGFFVKNSYIGFYKIAISLIITIAAILNLTSVLLPTFAESTFKKTKNIFEKSIRYISLITIPALTGIIILGREIITLIYGKAYLPGFYPLIILSPLILLTPLRQIFITLFNGTEKPKFPAKAVIYTTLINIILNYILIKYLATINQTGAIIGAAIATLISQTIFLMILTQKTKKVFKISIKKSMMKGIIKPLIASLIMAGCLIVIIKFTGISGWIKILLIPIGILIYLPTLIILKGISLEESKHLINSIIKRKKLN